MARCVEFNEVEKIEKAMNVFWEKGYNATSMQDLVDAMQINRSSLYNTIGDKHQLFMKCIGNYFDNAMLEVKEKVCKETSAKAALMAEYIATSFTGWKQSYILHGNPIKIKKMSEFLIKNIFK